MPRTIELELRGAIRGEVRFSDADRALYATDGSNYRQVPIGVVLPKDADDVIHTLAICRSHGVPVVSRGGGTSLAGQTCNTAVVLDFSKYMNRIIELDPEKRIARVQPGLVLDTLRNEAEKYHLTFGPDPSTHNRCTFGGMIGNNSCGVHAQMAGPTSHNIRELDIVTYDGVRMKVGATSELELERIIREGGRRGEIYARLKALRDRYADLIRERYPRIPRRISGYNLDSLLPENGFHVARALVGSESTCVTVLEATVELVHSPPHRTVVILGYPSVYEAGDHVPQINHFHPIGLEGLDDELVDFAIKTGIHPNAREELPDGDGWLLVEFGGDTKATADAKALAMMSALRLLPNAPKMKFYDDKKMERRIWEVRESGLGATARPPGEKITWEGWEDSAVPPENVGPYLRDLRKTFEKHGYKCALYGHFGQGCIHTRIDFDFETAEGIRTYRAFLKDATDLILKYGGSFSGEHGDGQSRGEFLVKMFGPELMGAMREFKSIWDPAWRMNPGKVVDAYRVDENLRLGLSYNPAPVKTHFKYPDDKGNMPFATLRCVGVGLCRRKEGGTMCPSYMATLEEKHSTRGRAHLLFELLTGDELKNGWKNEGVKDALDLCLSCKGCKKDCPVNVDMATYKAEFLSHYFQGKPRPRSAYAFGLIDVWAALASKAPGLVNFITQTPGLRGIAKALAGMPQSRKIPRFAPMTFKEWFARRGPRESKIQRVILWADTFSNHFDPQMAIAATEVLEKAGYQVIVPQKHLCCGRPLYDYGMLDLAKVYLRRILSELRPLIREGVPIVGLEPSCMSVFRDELRNLFPNDIDASRLRQQSFLFEEFLEKKAPQFRAPWVGGKAIVQTHCHHKSVLDAQSSQSLLKKMGIEAEVPEPGCCGMAGSFGFEAEKGRAELSFKIGEKNLLSAVRKSDERTLLIADGFSCRTQIEQGTGRKPLHMAEVIRAALRANEPVPTLQEPQMTMKNQIFDAAENFNRALALSRKSEKKPPGDKLALLHENPLPFAVAGVAILFASVAAGVFALRGGNDQKKNPSEPGVAA